MKLPVGLSSILFITHWEIRMIALMHSLDVVFKIHMDKII